MRLRPRILISARPSLNVVDDCSIEMIRMDGKELIG
jgi:hypothetical protein